MGCHQACRAGACDAIASWFLDLGSGVGGGSVSLLEDGPRYGRGRFVAVDCEAVDIRLISGELVRPAVIGDDVLLVSEPEGGGFWASTSLSVEAVMLLMSLDLLLRLAMALSSVEGQVVGLRGYILHKHRKDIGFVHFHMYICKDLMYEGYVTC